MPLVKRSSKRLDFLDFDLKHVVGINAVCAFFLITILEIHATNFAKISFIRFWEFIIGYTAITIICTSIWGYLFTLIKKQWTKTKYFVFAFITISTIWVCNAMYYYSCLNIANLSFSKILVNHLLTFPVGIIPAVVGYLLIRQKRMMSDLKAVKEQVLKLTFRVMKEESEHEMITLHGKSPKDSLTFFPQELLYIESKRNYVRIFYVENGRILLKSFIKTLTKIENALSDYPFLIRCHHAFIVNLYHIEKIIDYKIYLKSVKTPIPISRIRIANVKLQMNFIDRLSNN